MTTDAGDRPGMPEQFDREAAWNRFSYEPVDDRLAFFAELDAAVAWASRVKRERAANMVHAVKEETIRRLIHAGYDEPKRIALFKSMMDGLIDSILRSDPDAPAPTTKE